MFENILGWILVVALIALPVLIIRVVIKMIKKQAEARRLDEEAREERIRLAKEQWRQKYTGATHVGKTTYDFNTDKKRTVVKERATGRETSYVHTNDDGPDLLTTLIVADMLNNNKEQSSGTVKWNNDVPTVTESSSRSWGLDDDDSRRSVSSSFSSSDSSSSWSDSSSSSDSSPSSDW